MGCGEFHAVGRWHEVEHSERCAFGGRRAEAVAAVDELGIQPSSSLSALGIPPASKLRRWARGGGDEQEGVGERLRRGQEGHCLVQLPRAACGHGVAEVDSRVVGRPCRGLDQLFLPEGVLMRLEVRVARLPHGDPAAATRS